MNEIQVDTDRLTLRLIEISDLDAIHNLHALPETDAFNALGIPNNIEETKAIIEPWIAQNNLEEIENYTFAIELGKTQEFVGLFGLKLGSRKYKKGEVWYKIHVEQWNNGYATEALKGMISYGFNTLKLHRIEAGCAVENLGSIKVLENSGMIREGKKRQVLPLKTGWSDNFEYAILETDIRESQS
ncbi:GNAT family N-acetyltransferase [Flavobacteriaceae bacterium KMM 6897]|nr:GNAT family N-acetyltransferase [Flavobacteriaceae bacterium KMM 6897]MEB8347387.1 GNAT family N-acetyltransferase [Flavobacteriaceae bacterium KMM 6898]